MPIRNLTIAASLATVLLLAGCAGDPEVTYFTDPPGTATTKTADPGTEPDPQRAAEQEAIQRLKDYAAASNQLGQAGYEPDAVSAITEFTGGDYTGTYLDQTGWLRSQGAVQVGESTMTNFNVVDHHAVDDPFFDDQLTIEACFDTTDREILLPDGSSAVSPERIGRFVVTVTMWRWADEEVWVIAGWITDGERLC
jgi:hypothetical protein